MSFSSHRSGSYSAEGEVVKIIKQGKHWRVRYHATTWDAYSDEPILLQVGDPVRILRREGSTKLVIAAVH